MGVFPSQKLRKIEEKLGRESVCAVGGPNIVTDTQ